MKIRRTKAWLVTTYCRHTISLPNVPLVMNFWSKIVQRRHNFFFTAYSLVAQCIGWPACLSWAWRAPCPGWSSGPSVVPSPYPSPPVQTGVSPPYIIGWSRNYCFTIYPIDFMRNYKSLERCNDKAKYISQHLHFEILISENMFSWMRNFLGNLEKFAVLSSHLHSKKVGERRANVSDSCANLITMYHILRVFFVKFCGREKL